MNRLRKNSRISLNLIWNIIALVIVGFFLFIYLKGSYYISNSTLDEQAQNLENTLRKSVAQCYAVEGTYPPNLDYLKEHYALYYNEDLFYVDFTSIGANIMPDITILPKYSISN